MRVPGRRFQSRCLARAPSSRIPALGRRAHFGVPWRGRGEGSLGPRSSTNPLGCPDCSRGATPRSCMARRPPKPRVPTTHDGWNPLCPSGRCRHGVDRIFRSSRAPTRSERSSGALQQMSGEPLSARGKRGLPLAGRARRDRHPRAVDPCVPGHGRCRRGLRSEHRNGRRLYEPEGGSTSPRGGARATDWWARRVRAQLLGSGGSWSRPGHPVRREHLVGPARLDRAACLCAADVLQVAGARGGSQGAPGTRAGSRDVVERDGGGACRRTAADRRVPPRRPCAGALPALDPGRRRTQAPREGRHPGGSGSAREDPRVQAGRPPTASGR